MCKRALYAFFFTQISPLNSIQTWTLQYLKNSNIEEKGTSLKYGHHLRNIEKSFNIVLTTECQSTKGS